MAVTFVDANVSVSCDVFAFYRDITNMKGTIVAQVDSSESFQEFCSTGCLGAYENKQNPPKSGLKTKCTVCGKLTEVSMSDTLNITLPLSMACMLI